MNLRALLLALPLSFPTLLAGCGGDSLDADVAKFVAIADEACACKDEACFDKAKDKWDKLEEEMNKKYSGDKKPDKDKMKAAEDKVEAAEARAKECAKKVMGGGEAPPDSK